jgi:hypothetical protein
MSNPFSDKEIKYLLALVSRQGDWAWTEESIQDHITLLNKLNELSQK